MAQFSVSGKIFKIKEKESGVAQSGNQWQKIEFVIDTIEQYPKKMCFALFNDNCDLISDINVGDEVLVQFWIESREFNDRWFNNMNASGLSPVNQPKQEQEEIITEQQQHSEDETTDDLPF